VILTKNGPIMALLCMPNHTKTSYKMKWRLQSHNALHSAINLCCRSKLELIWKHKCVTNRRLPVCGPPSHPSYPASWCAWCYRAHGADGLATASALHQLSGRWRRRYVVWRSFDGRGRLHHLTVCRCGGCSCIGTLTRRCHCHFGDRCK